MPEDQNVCSFKEAQINKEKTQEAQTQIILENKIASFANEARVIQATFTKAKEIAIEEIRLVLDMYSENRLALYKDMALACLEDSQSNNITCILEEIPVILDKQDLLTIKESKSFKIIEEHCKECFTKEITFFTAKIGIKTAPPHMYANRKTQRLRVHSLLVIEMEWEPGLRP